jgi:hypothetical protein
MKAQIRASRNFNSATSAVSDSLVPSPDLESGVHVSSVAVTTSANNKTLPEALPDRERPGVTYVQSRAVGSLPAWRNRNSSPLTHAVANYVPPERRALSDVDDQLVVVRHERPMVLTDLTSNVEEVDKDLPIIAELAPDEAEVEARVADRLKVEMEERLEQQWSERLQKAAETIVVAEVVAEEVEVEIEARLCGLSRNFCYLLLSAGILVVAVGAVVGVVVGTNTSSSSIPSGTPFPTVYTTEAPTASPAIFSEKMKNLLDMIGSTVTSDINVFHNQSSLQYAALNWTSIFDLNDDECIKKRSFLERYVLVFFYLTTNGDSWKKRHNFLQNTSVCEWSDDDSEGVSCDGCYVTKLNLGT